MNVPVPNTPVPRHIAVIMDGNGRWAARRRRPRAIGHRAGARTVNLCIDFCLARGVEALTLFAFSSENWGRPEEEVGALMKLFVGALDREVGELHRRGVRLRFIGERSRFSEAIRSRMAAAETQTAGNSRLTLSVAASYGGRQDIAMAARSLAEDVAAGRLRISNFLLWQLAYTELWFTETLWPELGVEELEQALRVYASRERRFGLTGEQIAHAQDAVPGEGRP